ncbi:hypothetical protein K437DRAFT_256044 [Tilletiaria anomala UBC 951]|uniref:Uncharacterized protein n=1 Tax=Tilletiaria anomala (strain ATCC 24038 / CBS 436.72 / UBC 951) TaxID=1037660 RepID=A0A066W2J8_TILAU|nr:uncharacterized protein K437DRAFT_256044 [Tilletiaria anomala UBC 951]KDN46773.1 hypothetical protein K437DRAFT_256044 [Tilletiaria anomala UBC 951]
MTSATRPKQQQQQLESPHTSSSATMARASFVDRLPQLHLGFRSGRHVTPTAEVDACAADAFSTLSLQQALPRTPEANACQNHPWAATGGVPPAPKRQRGEQNHKRKKSSQHGAAAAAAESAEPSSSDTDNSVSHGRRANTLRCKIPSRTLPRASSVTSSEDRSSLLSPAAPLLQQSDRFESFPLPSPVESTSSVGNGHSLSRKHLTAFNTMVNPADAQAVVQMHTQQGAAAEETRFLPATGGRDPESKSRAWLAQCSAALSQIIRAPSSSQQPSHWASFSTRSPSPWTPSLADSLSASSPPSFLADPTMSPPSTVERSSTPHITNSSHSPASCTRSKAKRAAAAAQATRPLQPHDAAIYIPSVLTLARSTTTNRPPADGDAASTTSDADSSVASSCYGAANTANASSSSSSGGGSCCSASANHTVRPSLPWQLGSKSSINVRAAEAAASASRAASLRTNCASASSDRIPKARDHGSAPSALSPCPPSLLAFGGPIGLGINMTGGSAGTPFHPKPHSSSKQLLSSGVQTPTQEQMSPAKRGRAYSSPNTSAHVRHSDGISAAGASSSFGVFTMSSVDRSCSGSSASSSSHLHSPTRRSMSFSLSPSSSRARLGTPFSVSGSCGVGVGVGVMIGAGRNRSVMPDYFGDTWRSASARRVC